MSLKRGRLLFCIEMSILAFMTSLVGTVLDSVGAVAYSKLKACANSDNSNLSGIILQYYSYFVELIIVGFNVISGDSNYSQAETCFLVSHWFQPSSGVCYCAAATSCAVISYDSWDCSFLLDSYPLRLRDSAITSGVLVCAINILHVYIITCPDFIRCSTQLIYCHGIIFRCLLVAAVLSVWSIIVIHRERMVALERTSSTSVEESTSLAERGSSSSQLQEEEVGEVTRWPPKENGNSNSTKVLGVELVKLEAHREG